jgi:hypothetical protein
MAAEKWQGIETKRIQEQKPLDIKMAGHFGTAFLKTEARQKGLAAAIRRNRRLEHLPGKKTISRNTGARRVRPPREEQNGQEERLASQNAVPR